MTRNPTEDEVAGALAILKKHQQDNGLSATPSIARKTVYAIFAIMSGKGGGVADEFKNAAATKAQSFDDPLPEGNWISVIDDFTFVVTSEENPLKLPHGSVLRMEGNEAEDVKDSDEEPEDAHEDEHLLPDLHKMNKNDLLALALEEIQDEDVISMLKDPSTKVTKKDIIALMEENKTS